MKTNIALIFALLWASVSAASGHGYSKRTEGEYVATACKQTLVKQAIFCPKDTAKSYACQCKNVVAMGTLVYCGYQNTAHSHGHRKSFEDFFLQKCNNAFDRTKIQEAYNNVTGYIVTTKEIPNFNKTKPINVPIKFSEKVYKAAYRTSKVRYGNFDKAMVMGEGLMLFWAVVLGLGTIQNLVRKIMPRVWLSANSTVSRLPIVRKYRQYVTIPAAFNGQHTATNSLGGYLPTRLEFIVVFMFLFLTVIFHSVGFEYVENNTVWKTRNGQMGRYVGDRSGVLANFLCTLTWLFAGRNNVFLFLTGWKQSTFLTYHKWVARITVASVLVHTVAMLVHSLGISRSKYVARKQTNWWRWGSVATVAGCAMLIQGFSYLRSRYYEVFLYLHIVLAVFFLVGAWIHTEFFSYQHWLQACLAIWIFDRGLRIIRIAYFGIRKAKLRAVEGVIEVEVPYHKWWAHYPGAIGYIYFLGTPLFFQSHPFTMVTDENAKVVRFFIKQKKGATGLLYNRLLNKPDQTAYMRVALEGPYGNYFPLETYDNVLLYAGGNGIPGLYEYAKKLGRLSSQSKKVGFVKLYWVVRDLGYLQWFHRELKTLEEYNNVQVIVYVTRPSSGEMQESSEVLENSSNSSKEDRDLSIEKNTPQMDEKNSVQTAEFSSSQVPSIKSLPHVELRYGRPQTIELVHTDLKDTVGSSTAVMACGHNSMVDDIRKAVAYEVGQPRSGPVDYFEELQVW